MAERVVYLRRAIDQWIISKPIYARMILDKKEWEMIEFLVQFMHPFHVITTSVQATTHPSLHDTWIKYERMFDVLDRAKESFQAMVSLPAWLAEVQFGVEKMWNKLRDYYNKTDLPYAFVDATLLYPKLKVGFMTKANYDEIDIERYKQESEQRFKTLYDEPVVQSSSNTRPGTRKRPHPDDSSSSESEGEDFNEFSM